MKIGMVLATAAICLVLSFAFRGTPAGPFLAEVGGKTAGSVFDWLLSGQEAVRPMSREELALEAEREKLRHQAELNKIDEERARREQLAAVEERERRERLEEQKQFDDEMNKITIPYQNKPTYDYVPYGDNRNYDSYPLDSNYSEPLDSTYSGPLHRNQG